MNEENNEIIENMTQEERDKWHAVSNFFKQIMNLRLNNVFNSDAVGMAVAQSLGFAIDFVRNPISYQLHDF